MAYSTETMLRDESVFKDTSNIDTTYATRVIAQADSIIDSYIGNVYELPLSETPKIIEEISTNLAIYEMVMDQNTSLEIIAGVDVLAARELAMDMLVDICKRKIRLRDTNGDELTVRSLMKPTGYPNKTSTDAGTTPAIHTIDQKF